MNMALAPCDTHHVHMSTTQYDNTPRMRAKCANKYTRPTHTVHGAQRHVYSFHAREARYHASTKVRTDRREAHVYYAPVSCGPNKHLSIGLRHANKYTRPTHTVHGAQRHVYSSSMRAKRAIMLQLKCALTCASRMYIMPPYHAALTNISQSGS